MKKVLPAMIFLLVASTVIGLGINAVKPDGIPLIGDYREVQYGADSAIVPPSAEESDPPFITLKEAYGLYNDPETVFLDARDPEDYRAGYITGAINLPFDWFDDYWPDVEPRLNKDAVIVVYCSGAECELSLYEGRYLAEEGYKNIRIFFGGWTEWAEQGFPTVVPDDNM